MASQAPNMLPLLYNGLEPLNRNLHGNFKVRRLNGLDRVRNDPCHPGDGRRIRDGPAPFPDRLLGGRQSRSDRADGPSRGHQHLLRRGGQADRRRTSTCRPICAAIRSCWRGFARTATSCRCASIRRRTRSASSRMASRCSTATSRRKRPRPSSSSASSSSRPASAPRRSWPSSRKSGLLMEGEVAIQPEGARAAVRLSRLPDGRRGEVPEPARRRAAQAQPERRPAADHGASLLAVGDPRNFRPPGPAGHRPGAAAASRRPPRR